MSDLLYATNSIIIGRPIQLKLPFPEIHFAPNYPFVKTLEIERLDECLGDLETWDEAKAALAEALNEFRKPWQLKEIRWAALKFGVEKGHNRRVLTAISQNLRGESQPYPSVVNKRDLSQANGRCDKNVQNQVHRPITRKLAAQIANKKQCFSKDILKAKESKESLSVWEDCSITDVEDQPVPILPNWERTVLIHRAVCIFFHWESLL